MTLVKEDGTGKADANAYADVADGDAYHAGHLYATAWTGASADQKAVALVMASRLIDSEYQFNGLRSVDSQALQWPRVNCLDPDKAPIPILTSLLLVDPFVPFSIVPKALMQAKVAITDSGIASAAISVAGALRRNSNTISAARSARPTPRRRQPPTTPMVTSGVVASMKP